MDDNFLVVRKHNETGAITLTDLDGALEEIFALGVIVPERLLVRQLREGESLRYGSFTYTRENA